MAYPKKKTTTHNRNYEDVDHSLGFNRCHDLFSAEIRERCRLTKILECICVSNDKTAQAQEIYNLFTQGLEGEE